MPVISGTLKNASGVRPNTQIILRAVKTSGSVIKNAPDLSIKTDINGRYSFDCNPCTYHVQIMQQGHQREDAGVINVYTDTPNTSIELLLNELKEDDLTPEVIKQVEAFRSEILGYQQAAEQAAAQAKTNADKAASDNATLQQTVNTQLNAVNSSLAAKLDKTATAENSLKLGNVAASDYARSSAVVNLTGDQSVSGVKTFNDGATIKGQFNVITDRTVEIAVDPDSHHIRIYMDYGMLGDDYTFRHETIVDQENDRYGETIFNWHSRVPSDKRILTINGHARTNSDPIVGSDLTSKSYVDNNFAGKGAGGVGIFTEATRWSRYAATNDLDDTSGVACGIYSADVSTANTPSGSYGAGMVIYQPWGGNSRLQIFLGFHAGGINRMWTRTTSATGWYDWKELAGVDALPFQGAYTDVTTSRVSGVNYTNGAGKPLIISASASAATDCQESEISIYINGAKTQGSKKTANDKDGHAITAIIPSGATYKIEAAKCSCIKWEELS